MNDLSYLFIGGRSNDHHLSIEVNAGHMVDEDDNGKLTSGVKVYKSPNKDSLGAYLGQDVYPFRLKVTSFNADDPDDPDEAGGVGLLLEQVEPGKKKNTPIVWLSMEHAAAKLLAAALSAATTMGEVRDTETE